MLGRILNSPMNTTHQPANTVGIRPLAPEDSVGWAHLLESQTKEYRRSFFPFGEESAEALKTVLAAARKDLYWGVYLGEKMVGFVMLRGPDAGYERPSLGLLICESVRGMGLGRLAMQVAISQCRIEQVMNIMLKVAPDNHAAKLLYESMGFVAEGSCENTGHLQMNLELNQGRRVS